MKGQKLMYKKLLKDTDIVGETFKAGGKVMLLGKSDPRLLASHNAPASAPLPPLPPPPASAKERAAATRAGSPASGGRGCAAVGEGAAGAKPLSGMALLNAERIEREKQREREREEERVRARAEEERARAEEEEREKARMEARRAEELAANPNMLHLLEPAAGSGGKKKKGTGKNSGGEGGGLAVVVGRVWRQGQVEEGRRGRARGRLACAAGVAWWKAGRRRRRRISTPCSRGLIWTGASPTAVRGREQGVWRRERWSCEE